MHALLFANGEVSEREIRFLSKQTFDLIIAADGGARHALKWQLRPHYVVGDLDSITDELREQLQGTQFIHRPSQDLNDLEKTLLFCQEKGVNRLTLLGITGKRLDHTLTNLSVLSRFDTVFDLTLLDPDGEIFFVRNTFYYQGRIGQLISLVPLFSAEGITTQGLAYPLNDESLTWGVREGLSNVIVQNPVRISLKKGLLMVIAIYPEHL
ncbi:MAG: thiamine diphosphokinase [Calditrichaeota bacterium]|nr:thiamine diphosphokinase [Calditrichota bacterium]